jgi:hypothetical protein
LFIHFYIRHLILIQEYLIKESSESGINKQQIMANKQWTMVNGQYGSHIGWQLPSASIMGY